MSAKDSKQNYAQAVSKVTGVPQRFTRKIRKSPKALENIVKSASNPYAIVDKGTALIKRSLSRTSSQRKKLRRLAKKIKTLEAKKATRSLSATKKREVARAKSEKRTVEKDKAKDETAVKVATVLVKKARKVIRDGSSTGSVVRRRSGSPKRRRSGSPKRRRSGSPKRRRSGSPKRRRSGSRKRSGSPKRRRSSSARRAASASRELAAGPSTKVVAAGGVKMIRTSSKKGAIRRVKKSPMVGKGKKSFASFAQAAGCSKRKKKRCSAKATRMSKKFGGDWRYEIPTRVAKPVRMPSGSKLREERTHARIYISRNIIKFYRANEKMYPKQKLLRNTAKVMRIYDFKAGGEAWMNPNTVSSLIKSLAQTVQLSSTGAISKEQIDRFFVLVGEERKKMKSSSAKRKRSSSTGRKRKGSRRSSGRSPKRARRSSSKKTKSRKSSPRKSSPRKSSPRKSSPRKSKLARKSSPRKSSPRKSKLARKSSPRRTSRRKSSPRKSPRKSSPRKTSRRTSRKSSPRESPRKSSPRRSPRKSSPNRTGSRRPIPMQSGNLIQAYNR